MRHHIASIILGSALTLGAASAASGQDAEPQEGEVHIAQPRDDSRYLYELTTESALDCVLIQDWLAREKKEYDADYSRYHNAISLAWLAVADNLHGAALTNDEINPRLPAIVKQNEDAGSTVEALQDAARPCEIMSKLYSETYRGGARAQREQNPEIFADDAAYKNQTAGTYPDPPKKEMIYGRWFFFARGNSCLAAYSFDDGAKLTLGFTNFFDGQITFEWDGLPEIDDEADNYEEQLAVHREGAARSENKDDFLPVIAAGYDYETYPGTAIFVDETLIGPPFGMGQTRGQKYAMGSPLQSYYYNLLPVGSELRIKVLGKETHRVSIADPAFWNEMSNCMAQYPFG